jgi:hypothetical protein
MFVRSTATLSATTPVSSTANSEIHTMPPVSRRLCGRVRARLRVGADGTAAGR